MRGHHDMGGMPAGPVCDATGKPEEHDYELWEKRVDALMMLLSDSERQLLKVDELRRNIESLGADAYVTKQDFDQGMLIGVVQQLI